MQRVRVKEETERGDVAKSLQELIFTHFVSKARNDVLGATRLTRYEIMIIALLRIQNVVSKLISLTDEDVTDKALSQLSDSEKIEVKELFEMKKRFARNPHALSDAVYDTFIRTYTLGLQSLEGLSREEGVTLAGGTYQKILNPSEMGSFEKFRRRMMGNVLFIE